MVSHTNEAREHTVNMTHNIAMTHIELDIDYKVEDLRIKFTYCWDIWMFVCLCEFV